MYTLKNIDQINAMCELYKEGCSIRECAAAAQMSPNTVQKILKERGLTRPVGQHSPKTAQAKRSLPAPEQQAAPVEVLARLDERVRCASCGCTSHLEGANFCGRCGNRLETPQEIAIRALKNMLRLAQKAISVENEPLLADDYGTVLDYIRGKEADAC